MREAVDSDSRMRMRMRMIEIQTNLTFKANLWFTISVFSKTTSYSLYGRHDLMGLLTTSYCAPVICQVLRGSGTTTGSRIKLDNVVGRQKSFSVVVE